MRLSKKTIEYLIYTLQGKQLLTGFYPRADKLPLVLPTGDYVLLMTWKFYEKVQLVTNVYFTFVEDF